MAISARRMVTMFDLYYDRGQTNADQDLPIEARCVLLTVAYEAVFEELVRRSETSDRYRRLLRPFEIKHEQLILAGGTSTYKIAKYPKNLKKVLARRVTITKDGCGPRTIGVYMAQTNDLDAMLADSHWKPSYAWESCIGDEGSKGLYLYHGGDYDISKAEMDYIRKPSSINAPSLVKDGAPYTDINGNTTGDTPCEFDDESVANLIVDLAVAAAEGTLGNQRDYAMRVKKLVDQSGLAAI